MSKASFTSAFDTITLWFHHRLKAQFTLANFLCSFSRNTIVLQVARNIAQCNIPCYKWIFLSLIIIIAKKKAETIGERRTWFHFLQKFQLTFCIAMHCKRSYKKNCSVTVPLISKLILIYFYTIIIIIIVMLLSSLLLRIHLFEKDQLSYTLSRVTTWNVCSWELLIIFLALFKTISSFYKTQLKCFTTWEDCKSNQV